MKMNVNSKSGECQNKMDHDQTCTFDLTSNRQQTILKFNKHVKNLISFYEKFYKYNDNDFTDIEEDSEFEMIDESNAKTKNSSIDLLLESFDKLTQFVSNLKRDNSSLFMNIFQKTNSLVIQLIEFLSKLLNLLDNTFYHADLSDLKQKFQNKLNLINKTIQFIHVLITSIFFNFNFNIEKLNF